MNTPELGPAIQPKKTEERGVKLAGGKPAAAIPTNYATAACAIFFARRGAM